jgi:hypothetical protein
MATGHRAKGGSGLSILDCPVVFSNVYSFALCSVAIVTCGSGLSILDCPVVFSNVYSFALCPVAINRAIKNRQARTTGNNGDRTQSKRVNVRENNRAIKNGQARTTGNNGDRTQSKRGLDIKNLRNHQKPGVIESKFCRSHL